MGNTQTQAHLPLRCIGARTPPRPTPRKYGCSRSDPDWGWEEKAGKGPDNKPPPLTPSRTISLCLPIRPNLSSMFLKTSIFEELWGWGGVQISLGRGGMHSDHPAHSPVPLPWTPREGKVCSAQSTGFASYHASLPQEACRVTYILGVCVFVHACAPTWLLPDHI